MVFKKPMCSLPEVGGLGGGGEGSVSTVTWHWKKSPVGLGWHWLLTQSCSPAGEAAWSFLTTGNTQGNQGPKGCLSRARRARRV